MTALSRWANIRFIVGANSMRRLHNITWFHIALMICNMRSEVKELTSQLVVSLRKCQNHGKELLFEGQHHSYLDQSQLPPWVSQRSGVAS